MVFILRDTGIWYSTFAAYRDASREGEGKKEEREKRLPCNPESEPLQGVSSCCAKTHGRAYHVTPDLWWHGQQLPYSSSPYIRIHRVIYFLRRRNFSATAVGDCFTTHTYDVRTDCYRGGVHTVHTTKNPLPRTSYNVLVSIDTLLFSGSGTQSRQNN